MGSPPWGVLAESKKKMAAGSLLACVKNSTVENAALRKCREHRARQVSYLPRRRRDLAAGHLQVMMLAQRKRRQHPDHALAAVHR